jgi:hypothetical protein|tara:strand:- start:4519 stop:5751 length:1233 start_codon:yes stop_codon:yes gene_type:complete
MKKLLGIVVLSLLWSNIGFTEIIDIRCKDDPIKLRYSIDTSKKTVKAYWTEQSKQEQFELYDLLEIDNVRAIYQGTGNYKKFKWQFNYGGDGVEFRFEPEYKKIGYCKTEISKSGDINVTDNYQKKYEALYEFYFGDLYLSKTPTENDLYKNNIKIKEDLKIKETDSRINEAYCKEYKDSISNKIDPQNHSAQTQELKKIIQKLSNKIIIKLLPATFDDGTTAERNYAKDYFNYFYKSYFDFVTGLYFLQLSKNYDFGAKIILENFKNLENMNSSSLSEEIVNSVVTMNSYSKKLIECTKLFGTEKLSDSSKKFFVQSAAYISEANKSKNNIIPEAKLFVKKRIESMDIDRRYFIFDHDAIELSIIQVNQSIPDLLSIINDLNTLIISGAKANDIDIKNIEIIESLKDEL